MLVVALCFVFGQSETYGGCAQYWLHGHIKLTVKPGVKIKMRFAHERAPFDCVTVKGVKEGGYEGLPRKLDEWFEYETTETEVRVYGAIESFDCSGNGENITGIDLSHSGVDYLYCSYNQLSSLEVSGLEKLHCDHNQLSSLDVSKCEYLVELDCSYNQLSSLDVSECKYLYRLYCSDNQLSSLDIRSRLNKLDCSDNQLSSLVVSLYKAYNEPGYLDCSNNKLSSLVVIGGDYGAIDVNCNDNQLSSLDVSRCANLKELYCSRNQLSSLDVSKCASLEKLYCYNNQLSSLDVSKCANLKELYCSDNQLSSLNIRELAVLEKIWLYGNSFSTSTLNSIYCQLPDRNGKSDKGILCVHAWGGNKEDYLLAKSTCKAIADAKNWRIEYNVGEIAGNHTCGTTYALTLAPATLPNSFSYQGDEWKTTVTSTSDWKIDESTLPDWLSVEPKQGNSGTQVTIRATPNTEAAERSTALTFVLTNDITAEFKSQMQPSVAFT